MSVSVVPITTASADEVHKGKKNPPAGAFGARVLQETPHQRHRLDVQRPTFHCLSMCTHNFPRI